MQFSRHAQSVSERPPTVTFWSDSTNYKPHFSQALKIEHRFCNQWAFNRIFKTGSQLTRIFFVPKRTFFANVTGRAVPIITLSLTNNCNGAAGIAVGSTITWLGAPIQSLPMLFTFFPQWFSFPESLPAASPCIVCRRLSRIGSVVRGEGVMVKALSSRCTKLSNVGSQYETIFRSPRSKNMPPKFQISLFSLYTAVLGFVTDCLLVLQTYCPTQTEKSLPQL